MIDIPLVCSSSSKSRHGCGLVWYIEWNEKQQKDLSIYKICDHSYIL